MKKCLIFTGFLIAILHMSLLVAAQTVGPAAYLTEQVEAHYDHEGNIDGSVLWEECDGSNPCRYGYIDVAVSNQEDVLQYIRANISDTAGTNLESPTAFKGALSSVGSDWYRSRLYVETNLSTNDTNYIIDNGDQAPEIQLSLDYGNVEGGQDLYSADNIESEVVGDPSVNLIEFTLTATNPSTAHSLDDVNIAVQFDTEGGPDDQSVINLTDAGEGTDLVDSNDDGRNDRVEWTVTIGTDSSEDITFEGEMEENVHFSGDFVDLDADDRGTSSHWEDTAETFTGYTIEDKFSRGPIRQGTDLSETEGDWSIRGFMKNLANGLTYRVNEWALYNVTDTGELDQRVQHNPEGFTEDITNEHGRIRTTDEIAGSYEWYSTEAEKPYYATEMNWEVVWNDTNAENYFAYINTTLNMPRMYKIDMVNSKLLDGILNPDTAEAQEINITDETTHQGSEEVDVEEVLLISRVPGTTTNDESPEDREDLVDGETFFEIDEESVEVWFDGTEEDDPIDITGDVTVDITQPTYEGADGNVTVEIEEVDEVVGHNLNQSEKIRLEYSVYTNYTTATGDVFEFNGENTYVTESGTPLTEPQPEQTISVSAKRLIGFKDLIATDPEEPTVIDGILRVEVIDATEEEEGIEGIMFTDYVPLGTNFTDEDVTVEFSDDGGSSWTEWEEEEFYIDHLGTVELPSGATVEAYEYLDEDGGDGWHLHDDEMIRVSYNFNITDSGLYEMPATLVGIDPATGMEFGATAIGDVRVEIPEPEKDFEIRKGNIGLTRRVSVGDMAEWMRPVEVYNPNTRPVRGSFEVDLLNSVERAWVQYTDRDGETVRIDGDLRKEGDGMVLAWEERIPATSTRNYEIRAMTAPVMEVDRNVEVVDELPGQIVELKMDVFLRNFGRDPYEEVIFKLPIPVDDVTSVEADFGEELEYTGGEASTTIKIGEMDPDELKQVSIRYKKSYPTVLVTPEKESFDLDSPVNISILVINGGKNIDHARLESEIIGPGRNVVLSRIDELEDLEPLEETELTEEYILSPDLPSGDYKAHVRFREDFTTLASGTGNFYVKGAFEPAGGFWTVLILLIAVIGAGYLSYKRLQSIKTER